MVWKERGLGITLALLPTIIVLASAYIPLQENNFDWQRAIVNFDQIEEVVEKFQPAEISGDIIEIGDIEANEKETKLTLYVQSPLKTEMKIKEISVEILNSHGSNKLELQDEITLVPGEKKAVQLVGGGMEFSPDIRLGEMKMKIEVLGVTMEMRK
jgi:hypothetical protein